MTITEKTLKILWSRAAGRCSFPGCPETLVLPESEVAGPHTIGEMAHIKGKNPGSNRYDINQDSDERDAYSNLILLCPTHHTMIDKPENADRYPVDTILDYKLQHERLVETRLSEKRYTSLKSAKDAIACLLKDNEFAWKQFGPKSVVARQNPNSESVFAVWKSKRLGTIVPNNRSIIDILNESRELFGRSKQEIISEFFEHVSSYELWVNDDIPYQAVRRFPKGFEMLIMEDD